MDIYDLSYQIFKPIIGGSRYFTSLNQKLKLARIKTTPNKYGSFILFSGLLGLICSFIILLPIGTIEFGELKLIHIIIYLLISSLVGATISLLIYFYPDIIISDLRKKVDNSLAFVTIYMSTIAKSGFPPQHIFKLLSKFKDYKIIAEEAKIINNDVEGLGIDLPSALTRAMNRSISPSWTELLVGLRNSITVGGDITKFLEEKSKGFILDYKRKLEEFSNMLTTLMHMYITVVIVGTVFFIVVSSLMATVGGMSIIIVKFIQYSIVLVGLPLITALLIMLIRSTSPWSN